MTTTVQRRRPTSGDSRANDLRTRSSRPRHGTSGSSRHPPRNDPPEGGRPPAHVGGSILVGPRPQERALRHEQIPHVDQLPPDAGERADRRQLDGAARPAAPDVRLERSVSRSVRRAGGGSRRLTRDGPSELGRGAGQRRPHDRADPPPADELAHGVPVDPRVGGCLGDIAEREERRGGVAQDRVDARVKEQPGDVGPQDQVAG